MPSRQRLVVWQERPQVWGRYWKKDLIEPVQIRHSLGECILL